MNRPRHDDDDVDPIIREIDVVLSPEMCSQLHLLQYPLQPVVGNSQSNVSPVAARMKPHHQILELDYALDHDHESRFSDLKNRSFVSHIIPIQTHLCLGRFASYPSDSVPNPSRLGSYQKLQQPQQQVLHLVPLQYIRQMRPSFDHVPSNTSRASSSAATTSITAAAATNMDVDDKSVDTMEDRKPIVFQRKESERALNARKNSYAYYRNSRDSEPYMDLEIVDSVESYQILSERLPIVTSVRELNRLNPIWAYELSSASTNTTLTRSLPTNNEIYIHSLNYQSTTFVKFSKMVHTSPSSTFDDVVTSLIPKVTRRLLRGTPVPYSVLRNQFITIQSSMESNLISDLHLITALAVCAVLVRGNFVLRSGLVPSHAIITHAKQQQTIPRTGTDLIPINHEQEVVVVEGGGDDDTFYEACYDPLLLDDPLPWTPIQKKARTFLLLLFELYDTVNRTKLQQAFSPSEISPNVWYQMMCTLGRFDRDRTNMGFAQGSVQGTWRFKVGEDMTMLRTFPDYVSLHKAYWDRNKIRYAARLAKYHGQNFLCHS
jgi:hypothetical protein